LLIIKIKYKKGFSLIAFLILSIILLSILKVNQHVIPTVASPLVKLPIIMYHHILKNPKSWGKYVVSPSEFEDDIIYLKKEGYSTIVMQDLIDFVYNKKELPLKPIMLTIDDGFSSDYSYILPILEKHGCKAVVSIVGEYVDKCTDDPTLSKAYLNWEQVKGLVDSSYVEIQNHSYSMHDRNKRKGSCKMKGESYDHYKKILNEDVGKLQTLMGEKTGYMPTAFTYPYGFISRESNQILTDMGFLATLSCYTGINFITGNKDELYELKRFNRPSGVSQEQFFKQFEK